MEFLLVVVNLKYCRHNLYDLTDHQSILPLFQGRDAGAAGLEGCSRPPSHHRCFSASPGGPQAAPSPARICLTDKFS